MPPRPSRPMNKPWPIHSGHGAPKVEIDRPTPIIRAPPSTVQRVPIRLATRPRIMPPTPEQSQASALASAGTSRAPPASAAMSLSATGVIQAPPKAISSVTNATLATVHEARLSIEAEEDCNIEEPGRPALFAEPRGFDHPRAAMAALLLRCAKMR